MFKNRARMMVVVFATLVLCLSLPGHEAHALSDQEYKELLKYPPFREADKELNRVWKESWPDFKATGDKDFYLNQQREWLKSTRDEEARLYMKAGLPFEEAHTRVVRRRINQIGVLHYNCQLAPNELGSARTLDFYNEGELELPEDVDTVAGNRTLTTSDEFDALTIVNLARSMRTAVAFPVTTRLFASWLVWSGNRCVWGFHRDGKTVDLTCGMPMKTASGTETVYMNFLFEADYDEGRCYLQAMFNDGLPMPDKLKDEAIVELIQMMLRDQAKVPDDIKLEVEMRDDQAD